MSPSPTRKPLFVRRLTWTVWRLDSACISVRSASEVSEEIELLIKAMSVIQRSVFGGFDGIDPMWSSKDVRK